MGAPRPIDVGQLRSFLGLMNYYEKFLPNLSSILGPLYLLLQRYTPWVWGKEQEDVFNRAKGLLVSNKLLEHFDPEKALVVTCDASPYGLGAVLSHRMRDGSDRPVHYASRSLSNSEKGYSQLDKEGLAIVFAVKKFHQFLYGREFTINSDHKPLQYIFSHDKPVPPIASARLQRWALLLEMYDYRIEYKAADQLRHADGLGRLPLPFTPANLPIPGETVLLLDNIELASLNVEKIRHLTDCDPVLSRVRFCLLHGWDNLDDKSLAAFHSKRDELSIQDGCVLRGSRVIIPTKGRELVLEMLHQGHPGISRMKNIARGFVWWPGMDIQLENKVMECEQCFFVNFPDLHPLKFPYNHGSGHNALGGVSTWTTLAPISERCSSW